MQHPARYRDTDAYSSSAASVPAGHHNALRCHPRYGCALEDHSQNLCRVIILCLLLHLVSAMLLAIRLNIGNLSARKHVLQETATCVGNLQEIWFMQIS